MGIFVNRGNGSFQSACRYDKSCNSRTIFESLKIAGANSFEEHLNQYDVIHYIQSCYEALHTTSSKYIINDIQLYIESRLS